MRRKSTTSTKAKSSGLFQDENFTNFLPESKGKKSSHFRRSGALGPDDSPLGVPIYGSSQPTRRRGRTNSTASYMSGETKASGLVSQGASIPVTDTSFSIVADISQRGLEQVIESRLIETFLTVSILPGEDNSRHRITPVKIHSLTRMSVFGGSTSMHRAYSVFLPTESKGKANTAATKPQLLKFKASQSRSPSSSVSQTNGDDTLVASSCLNRNVCLPLSTVPDFFSPIHRPSINPVFSIDARPGHDFSSESDTSCNRMRVQLWGHAKGPKVAGKQRQRSSEELIVDLNSNWTVIEEWEFSLDDLVPLSEDVRLHVYGVYSDS